VAIVTLVCFIKGLPLVLEMALVRVMQILALLIKCNDKESKTSSDRIMKNRFQTDTTTRIDFLQEFPEIINVLGSSLLA
jgi:hypothetical protein